MARTKLEIDKVEFQKVVDDLEANNTFENPSILWKAVEESVWAKGLLPRPLTAGVAYARAKELGIIVKAKPGKRGGGLKDAVRGPRTPCSAKMAKHKDSFDAMKKEVPKSFIKLVDRLEKKGSVKAAIKLKCLECSSWKPSEIKHCPCLGCGLYPVRPYQGKGNDKAEELELEAEGV